MSVQAKKLIPVLLCMILVCFLPSAGWADINAQANSRDETSLLQFEQAVEAAGKELDILEADFNAEKKILGEEHHQQQIYKIQMNSLRNFLIVPEIRVSVLENGIGEVDISLSIIQSRLQKIEEREKKAGQNLSLVNEKIILIDQRISEIASAKDNTIVRKPGIKAFKEYRAIKEKQQKVLLTITELLASQKQVNTSLLNEFKDIRATLIKEIKDKKGGLLFQRNDVELETLFFTLFKPETTLSFASVRHLFSYKQVSIKWSLFKEHMNLNTIVIIAGFLLISLLGFRGVSLLRQKASYQKILTRRTGYPLIVLERSLGLIFWILLAATLSKTRIYLIFPDAVNFFKSFLMIILMTRIASDSIRLIAIEKGPVFFDVLYRWRNKFIYGIRIYSFVYLLVYRLLSLETLFLVSVRIFSEAVLVVGVFLFWQAYNRMDSPAKGLDSMLLRLWSTAVVILGLFADIAGYGSFAAFWYVSWGISIVVVCVCVMLMYSIQEIDQKFKKKLESKSSSSSGLSGPFYWVLSNGVYFFIIAFGLLGLAFSWGVYGILLAGAMEMFHKKYMMGEVELSLAGVAYSLLVLLLTYFLTRIWRRVVTEHALKKSGLSQGAKETVITISIYLIWAVGILISLSVFGLNTTSITVAFGALSIGLGFGLQNIANNFVSGLILLFERPIQVGDVVEVGGVWGEVKKINVRATLVQTYSNSSLIIPNSEFISATVTNWSHKDPHLRKDLAVGVAYGSDTELVKKLLLEAADIVPQVYDYPKKPVVQFINFGDSSLDFRLRFWSTIDDFVDAESNLRFEIDRLFRKHDVVIPFPQRDLHIVSGPQVNIGG